MGQCLRSTSPAHEFAHCHLSTQAELADQASWVCTERLSTLSTKSSHMGFCSPPPKAHQNPWLIPDDMTFLAVQMAVACEIHSRECMPAFSQMAGRRLPPPVLNCRRKRGQKMTHLPTFLLTSPLPSSLLFI